MLDVLARRGLRATFFVVGRRLEDRAARAACERAHAEGHWIGNHTWSHATPLGLVADAAGARSEIERTQELLGSLAHPDRLFRPMGGGGRLGPHVLSRAALETLVDGRYSLVLWDAVPGDWRDPDGWVPRALAACERGGVLVLHDIAGAALGRLEEFLDMALARGVRFEQELPPSAMPIVRGEITGDVEGLVT